MKKSFNILFVLISLLSFTPVVNAYDFGPIPDYSGYRFNPPSYSPRNCQYHYEVIEQFAGNYDNQTRCLSALRQIRNEDPENSFSYNCVRDYIRRGIFRLIFSGYICQ